MTAKVLIVLIVSGFAFFAQAAGEVNSCFSYGQQTVAVKPVLVNSGSLYGTLGFNQYGWVTHHVRLDQILCIQSVSEIKKSQDKLECLTHFQFQKNNIFGQVISETGTFVTQFRCPISGTEDVSFTCPELTLDAALEATCGHFKKQLKALPACP